MSFLIENNNFSNDSYNVRETRLYFVSNSIDAYSAELLISDNLLAWAQGAYEVFKTAKVNQSVVTGEKDEAFQSSQEADTALAERYQILKDILISRYTTEDDKLKVYGIFGPTPAGHAAMIFVSEVLVEGNNRFKIVSDPNVLPDTMINNLQLLIDNSKQKYYDAGLEREDATVATVNIHKIFNDDSKKLRELYNWVIAFWGKFDLRLIILGFVQAENNAGGHVPVAPNNLAFDADNNLFTWENVLNASSYQLVYKATGTENDWEDIYSGDLTEFSFTPQSGDWSFKIRARNENGYGNWSLNLDINITEPEPIIINPPTGIEFHIANMTVRWLPVENASSYIAMISIDDGASYQEIYAGSNTFFVYQPSYFGTVTILIKGLNSFSNGPYSEPYIFSYFDVLPPVNGLTISLVSETTGLIRLNFEEVASATTYKIFRSVVGLGMPAGEFTYITEQSVNEYFGNTTPGMRNWFHVKAANDTQMSAASEAVFIDMTGTV